MKVAAGAGNVKASRRHKWIALHSSPIAVELLNRGLSPRVQHRLEADVGRGSISVTLRSHLPYEFVGGEEKAALGLLLPGAGSQSLNRIVVH